MADTPEERQQPKPDPAALKQDRRPNRRVGRRSYVDRALEPNEREVEPRERTPGEYVTK